MADNVLANATKRVVRPQDYTYHTPISALGAVGVLGEVQLVNAAGTGVGTGAFPLSVILVDAGGEPIASLGGGIGSGNNVYSNASGDFTTEALTGTKDFNVIGPSFVVEAANVALGSVKKISGTASTDVELTSISVTGTTGGYVITVSDEDANFIGTDVIAANIVGPWRSYDTDLDIDKVVDQAHPYAHFIDPVALIASAQNLTGPFTDVGGEIDGRTYNAGVFYVNIDINGATGVAFKLLVKHESGGSEEYVMDPNSWFLRDSTTTSTGGIKVLDSNVDDLYQIPFEINNANPYLQFQVGAPSTAGTAGNLGQLDTVFYTLGYK